jgi:hypothetical protein
VTAHSAHATVSGQVGVSNFERLDRAVMRELDAESERLAAFHA